MKKIYSFLFLGLASLNTLCINDIALNEKVIAHKVVIIKKMIKQHQYVIMGLTAIGCLQQLSYWFPVFTAGIEYFVGDTQKTCVCQATETIQGMEQKEELGFFATIARDTKDLFGTATGWRRIGDAGLYLTGQIGALVLFQKISEATDHRDTLRWYVHAKVPYGTTLKIIEKLVHSLSGDHMLDDAQRLHYKASLQASCQQLARYTEDICAYMMYKCTLLPKNQKIHAERIARYFFNCQNDVFHQLRAILNQQEPQYEVILSLIKAYQAELNYQKELFASVEGDNEQAQMLLFEKEAW